MTNPQDKTKLQGLRDSAAQEYGDPIDDNAVEAWKAGWDAHEALVDPADESEGPKEYTEVESLKDDIIVLKRVIKGRDESIAALELKLQAANVLIAALSAYVKQLEPSVLPEIHRRLRLFLLSEMETYKRGVVGE